MNKRIDFSKLKVEVSLRNKGQMKAQLAIEYYGLRITHFRVMEDKETGEIFLQVPMLKVWSKYQQMFWIPNKEDFNAFQNFMLNEYTVYKEKLKRGEAEDNTPLDEIDLEAKL